MFQIGKELVGIFNQAKNENKLTGIRDIRLVDQRTANNISDFTSLSNSIYVCFEGRDYDLNNKWAENWSIYLNLKNENSQVDINKIADMADLLEFEILECLKNSFGKAGALIVLKNILKQEYLKVSHFSSTFLQIKMGFSCKKINC
jgi:hypothetical protein